MFVGFRRRLVGKRRPGEAVMAASGFSSLSRKNGIKLAAGSPCSVEDAALAVGEQIGHGSVKSAAWVNRERRWSR